LPFRTLKEVA
jgi:hypothetical protein